MTLDQKLQAFAAKGKNKATQCSAVNSRAKQKKIVVQDLQKRTSNLNSSMKRSKLSKPYQIKLTAISRLLLIFQIKSKATLTITL